MIRTHSVDLVARAFEVYLGIQTTIGDMMPPNLVSAAGLSDRALRNATAGKPNAGNEIRLAIVDAQKASTLESFRSSVTSIDGIANEVVVLLAGDNVPASLEQSFFVVNPADSVDKVTNEARVRAEKYGSYGFVLRSPPTMRDLGLVMVAVEKIKIRRLSGGMLDFEEAWQELKSVAAGLVRVTEKWFANRRDATGSGAGQ